jgi:hypothetical protein
MLLMIHLMPQEYCQDSGRRPTHPGLARLPGPRVQLLTVLSVDVWGLFYKNS